METDKLNVRNKKCTIAFQSIGENITNNIENVIVNLSQETQNPNINEDFNVPRLVKSFCGRDNELKQLSTWFFEENKSMVTICGLPGYGKTELAKHFAQDCKNQGLIDNIIWIDSETSETIENSFRELLKWLGGKSDMGIRTVVQMVYKYYEKKRNLFVFDNAQDRQSVLDYEPVGKCISVVTSHVEYWGDDIPSLTVTPLSTEAALTVLKTILLDRYKNSDNELYKKLTEILNCVPLALQIAGAYVLEEIRDLRDEFDLNRYVESLQNSCNQYLEKSNPGFSKNPYKISIYESVKKSINKIEKIEDDKSHLALNVLHTSAYLNPNKILLLDLQSFKIFKRILSNIDKKLNLLRAVSLLENYSFVQISAEKDETNFNMHRLIQETLILYQTNIIKSKHNKYYIICLKFIVEIDRPTPHMHYIFKYAKDHLDSFKHFYPKNKTRIITTRSFLNSAVVTGCKIFLNEILDDLNHNAATMINERGLLYLSVKRQQHKVTELLLTRGAYVDQRNETGQTSLIRAAALLDMNAIKLLTTYKADTSILDTTTSYTALHAVIFASSRPEHFNKSKESCDIIRWLVKCGADINTKHEGKTFLHEAAKSLNVDLIQCLVVEYQLEVNAIDDMRMTPLHYVCIGQIAEQARRLRTAECLIRLGATVNIQANHLTPIDMARTMGMDYMVNYLQDPTKGCELIEDNEGDILKSLIVKGDKEEISKKLDELGENSVTKIDEYCLLHIAVRQSPYEVTKLLLSRGANVNNPDDGKRSPLHYAVLNQRIVELLVTHRADVNAKDAFGLSVLASAITAIAAFRQQPQLEKVVTTFKWLVEHGATVDNSLLHWAVFSHSTELVQYLVKDLGLDVNAEDSAKRTPICFTTHRVKTGHVNKEQALETTNCLLKLGARLPSQKITELPDINTINNCTENNVSQEATTKIENNSNLTILKISYKEHRWPGIARRVL